MAEKTTPANRSEEEIAGYRAVLDTIHASAAHIAFKPSVVEQLHRDLYQFTDVPAGRWKTVENAIDQERRTGRGLFASARCKRRRRQRRWRSFTRASPRRFAQADIIRCC